MVEPRPLVCVSLQLPPSDQPLLRIHEIAWNDFLPPLDHLNRAFEAAEVTHPPSEAGKLWLETRKDAATKIGRLQDVYYTNYNAVSSFVAFLDALHKGRSISEAYRKFQVAARKSVRQARIAQEAIINIREDLRIVVGRITGIMSDDGKDMSSFISESSQSMLEFATAVEECGAVLEEYLDEYMKMQRKSFDETSNLPSDEEFQMVEGKWRAFFENADRLRYRWEPLRDRVRGYKLGSEPAMAVPNNPTSPKVPPDPPQSRRVPFWRKFFRRISSCLRLEGVS